MRTSSYVIKTSCSFLIPGSVRSGSTVPHTALRGQLCRAFLSVFLGGQSQGHWGDLEGPSALRSLLWWGAVSRDGASAAWEPSWHPEVAPLSGVQILPGRYGHVERLQLGWEPWIPGVWLEHSAQGRAVQPGLSSCTSAVLGHRCVSNLSSCEGWRQAW